MRELEHLGLDDHLSNLVSSPFICEGRTSMIVPGVPMTTCCVSLGIPRCTESRPAWKHSTGVYSPMRCTTDMICRASSRDGAIQIAYEHVSASERAGSDVLGAS